MTPVKPFLKWAGGKARLVPHLTGAYNEALRRSRREHLDYFEPFLGGGALFFAAAAGPRGMAYLNDVNGELMNAYAVVTNHTSALIAELASLEAAYNTDTERERRAALFAACRTEFNAGIIGGTLGHAALDVRAAALLIFLNKTCFNGLYRVNRRGAFNSPHGSYGRPVICDGSLLAADSAALGAGVELTTGDFATAVASAQDDGAFVYFDPPYVPLSATSDFTAYAGPFGVADQRRLADTFRELADSGVWVVASNSSAPAAVGLYAERGAYLYMVPAARAINSKADRRGAVAELIATSFRCPELEGFAYSP